jgi:polysaccharide deacetylase family protein (PEP-CTERM system associated)
MSAVQTGASIVNAMTIDVEDFFQVSAFDDVVPRGAWESYPNRVVPNTRRLLQIFEENGVTATFFVLAWVADRHPELVAEISAAGHEIASHGYGHQLVYNQTPEVFREDVRRAKSILEDLSSRPVRGYRAPSYSITRRSLWALDVLVEEGYTYDASIFPIRHDRYGIPGAPRHAYALQRAGGTLTEAPPSTVRIGPVNLPVAGGGYFRLLPYGWTRWGIARINRHEAKPAIFYLHPWEIDPDQPWLKAGFVSRFRHYRNLHKTEPRLRQLLRDFRFGPLGTLLDQATIAPVAGLAPSAHVVAGGA